MKQSAVNWLIDQLEEWGAGRIKWPTHLWEQAESMEKEQIIEAFKHGELPPLFVNYNAEQYYNETYEM